MGPSLTEGYPAENPAVRLYETDDASWALQDSLTYTADVLDANKDGTLDWRLEYSAKERFRMTDLGHESWEKVAMFQLMLNETAFRDHISLRNREYVGPPSPSTSPKCQNLTDPCAVATLCKIIFYADADVSNCIKN